MLCLWIFTCIQRNALFIRNYYSFWHHISPGRSITILILNRRELINRLILCRLTSLNRDKSGTVHSNTTNLITRLIDDSSITCLKPVLGQTFCENLFLRYKKIILREVKFKLLKVRLNINLR